MNQSDDVQTITIPVGFDPRPYQREVLQKLDGDRGDPSSKFRRALLIWHRRAGKDIVCWCYLIKEAATHPGLYYYFWPTYKQGRLALWEGIDQRTGKRYLEYLGGMKEGQGVIAHIKHQEMSIELINGSIIRIIGTDDYDSIRGTNPIGAVFSEYAWQDPGAWQALRSIFTVNKGWAIFNSTPDGPNHLYTLYNMAQGNSNWIVSHLTVEQTQNHDGSLIVPVADIEEERRSGMAEDMIQQEYYCNFKTQMQGAVYGDLIIKAREESRVGDYPANDNTWVRTYWDLGADDYTAIWFQQIQDGKVVWVDYYEDRDKAIHHYVKVLQQKDYKYQEHFLPHDAAAKAMPLRISTADILASALREAGLGSNVTICPRLGIQDGINGTRARFSRFYFNEATTADALVKLEMYHRSYDAKKQIFSKVPVHDKNSHCADALRMEYNSLSDVNEMNDKHGDMNLFKQVFDFDPREL